MNGGGGGANGTTADKFPVRLLLEQAGGSAKRPLEMMSSDSMAELRAEVTQWWHSLHATPTASPPFRILAQGKEIGEVDLGRIDRD